jgi:hypothetical protein
MMITVYQVVHLNARQIPLVVVIQDIHVALVTTVYHLDINNVNLILPNFVLLQDIDVVRVDIVYLMIRYNAEIHSIRVRWVRDAVVRELLGSV